MGKAAKTRRSEQRKAQKRARKAATQAVYESYKKSGSNKKSKRNTAANRAGVSTSKHIVANCGNQGCERCYPDLAMPRMNAPHARLAPAVKRKKKSAALSVALLGSERALGSGLPDAGSTVRTESFHFNPATGLPE